MIYMSEKKSLLITGASGGIGEAIANKFREHNYAIFAPRRDELNLADSRSIKAYLAKLTQAVDVFVHCAGINDPKLIETLSEADIQETFQVNTLSFYTISRHLAAVFREKKSGYILAVSSIYGEFSRKKRLAYATSKHALNAMVKTLALELGEDNIFVNAVSPGFIGTKLTYKNNSSEVIERFKKKIPLARLGTPDDIAKIAYFLCSPENAYIHGQCIIADGGYSVGGFEE